MASPLRILAGPAALVHLRERGLRLEDVGVLVGAAGGAKFLMLSALDRVLFTALRAAPRGRPIHCVGSSIGAWRLACLASSDPAGAVARLAEGYIAAFAQGGLPGPAAARRIGAHLLAEALAGDGADAVADHPRVRLHVITSRCRGLSSSERRPLLAAGLGLAAAGNAVSRRTLDLQIERVIFHSGGDPGPLRPPAELRTRHARLDGTNLHAALIASAAVPLFLQGLKIPGAPTGTYRDGGIVDYNPVFDYGPPDHLVLYPHYFDHLTPGWFDRSLPRRRARGPLLARTVVVAPTDAFVASMPGGARPTRKDLRRLGEGERDRRLRAVLSAGAALGDALGELLASGRVAQHVHPLP